MKLVSDAHQLDLRRLNGAGFFSAPVGSIWTSEARRPGSSASSIAYYALLKRVSPDQAVMGIGSPPQRDLQLVELEATPCWLGGQRWWFRCPNESPLDPDNPEEPDDLPEAFEELLPGTRRCIGRCLVLYRPAPGDQFSCRNCSRLSYPSRRFHRSFFGTVIDPLIDRLKHLDATEPDDLRELLTKRGNFRKYRGESS